jgi:hypothetical protein
MVSLILSGCKVDFVNKSPLRQRPPSAPLQLEGLTCTGPLQCAASKFYIWRRRPGHGCLASKNLSPLLVSIEGLFQSLVESISDGISFSYALKLRSPRVMAAASATQSLPKNLCFPSVSQSFKVHPRHPGHHLPVYSRFGETVSVKIKFQVHLRRSYL